MARPVETAKGRLLEHDKLSFVRNCAWPPHADDKMFFGRHRRLYVVRDEPKGTDLVKVAVTKPLQVITLRGRKNVNEHLTKVDLESGFPRTLWLPASFIRKNCRKLS